MEENLSIIQSKLTNSVTNRKKNKALQKITDAVNGIKVVDHTVAEIHENWKNLHSQAKKEFIVLSEEQKKTGGGSA